VIARRLLIVSPEPSLVEALNSKLSSGNWGDIVVEGSYPSAGLLGNLLLDKQPAAVIIGLSDPERGLELIQEMQAGYPGFAVVAAHTSNAPDLILAAVRSGAAEFLGPPFELEYLERALAGRATPAAAQPAGRMISFLPACGGCGASTVAMHVAAAIAQQSDRRTLLLDWDLHSSSSAFRLRLKPEFTLADALQRSGSLDELWPKLVCRSKGLDLLPPPAPYPNQAEDLGRAGALLQSARRTYDWAVSDLPPAIYTSCVEVINQSETVYVVTTPEIVSLHLARRKTAELRDQGVAAEAIRIIVNRESEKRILGTEEVRKIVGVPVAWTLQNDYRAINAAFVEGRLLESDSDLGREFRNFVRQVLAVHPSAPQPSKTIRWNSLFSRGSAEPVSSRLLDQTA